MHHDGLQDPRLLEEVGDLTTAKPYHVRLNTYHLD